MLAGKDWKDFQSCFGIFFGFFIREMGCPALGVWVAFLKQAALPAF
jgi:hypothetical protein